MKNVKLLVLFGFIAGVISLMAVSKLKAVEKIYSVHYEILKKFEAQPEMGITKLGEQMKTDCEANTDKLQTEQTVSQCRANVGAFVQTYLNADKSGLPVLYSSLMRSYEAAMKRKTAENDLKSEEKDLK